MSFAVVFYGKIIFPAMPCFLSRVTFWLSSKSLASKFNPLAKLYLSVLLPVWIQFRTNKILFTYFTQRKIFSIQLIYLQTFQVSTCFSPSISEFDPVNSACVSSKIEISLLNSESLTARSDPRFATLSFLSLFSLLSKLIRSWRTSMEKSYFEFHLKVFFIICCFFLG